MARQDLEDPLTWIIATMKIEVHLPLVGLGLFMLVQVSLLAIHFHTRCNNLRAMERDARCHQAVDARRHLLMVEVPAAISQIPFWAQKIDFISIGKNRIAQALDKGIFGARIDFRINLAGEQK